MPRVSHHSCLLLVIGGLFVAFPAPGATSRPDKIVGMWTAAATERQIRVDQTGVRIFAGRVVKPYMLGPCTNRVGRVVWKQVTPLRLRPGHYNGTFAGYAFMTQDPSTCDPSYTAPMTATIGVPAGGKLSMRVCYFPGGCSTWTRPIHARRDPDSLRARWTRSPN